MYIVQANTCKKTKTVLADKKNKNKQLRNFGALLRVLSTFNRKSFHQREKHITPPKFQESSKLFLEDPNLSLSLSLSE